MLFVPVVRFWLCLTCLSLCALAQSFPSATPTPTPPPAPTPQLIAPETEKAALELLRVVVSDADGFRLPDNRFMFKVAAGQLLWPHDADKARTLYREAAAAWLQWAGSLDPENIDRGGVLYRLPQRRVQMLTDLAERDASLALTLQRETRAAIDPALLGLFEQLERGERDLELTLIAKLGEQDTAVMFKLAQEHLGRYGVSNPLVELVKKLKERDRPKAAQLGAEMVSRLSGADLRTNSELRQVALELWQASLPEAAKPETEGRRPLVSDDILLERSDFRLLSEHLATVLEKGMEEQSDSDEVLRILHSHLPVLEKYAPGTAAKVRREMRRRERNNQPVVGSDETATAVASQPDVSQEYREKLEKASLAEALNIISQAPDGVRDGLYYQLGSQIEEAPDPEQARRLLLEKMPNSPFRGQLLSQLDARIVAAGAAQGDIAKVRAQLAGIKNEDKRYMMLIQAAVGIAEKDRATALKLLDEAAPLLKQPARTFTRLGTQATLLMAYAVLDPKQGLDVLETMAGRVDELIPSALVLAEFVGETEFMQDDEVRVSVLLEGNSVVPQDLTRPLVLLAQYDFARLKNIAERFQRSEARTLARLLVASAVLDKSRQD